jgi:CBS domain containing-hemolysin-like protein
MEGIGFGSSVSGLIAIAVLILVNAYFVATEFALIAVRGTQIELWVAEGRRGAKAAANAIEHLDEAIAATQLGITGVSIALGFVGEPVLAQMIAPLLAVIGIDSAYALHTVSLALAFVCITFLHVVVGEFAPKALALDRPGRVVLTCARPLLLFASAVRPALWLIKGTGNVLVRALGVRPAGQAEIEAHSAEELSLLVAESRAAGEIRPYAGRMLGNVFRLGRTRLRDVMVPREKVVAIDRGIRSDALLDLIKESGFTRIPVYDGAFDNMIGILHTKDLFQVYADRRVVILEDAIRDATFFPSDLSLVNALRRFRRSRQHLAIVRDEGGPVIGILTLEDVLEQIVGDIEDEHD